MTARMDGHIRLDDRGVAYVGDSRLKLLHLAIAYRSVDGSMEGLRDYYDWLPLADAHAAVAYYLDHQSEVDREIEDDRLYADVISTAQRSEPSSVKVWTS